MHYRPCGSPLTVFLPVIKQSIRTLETAGDMVLEVRSLAANSIQAAVWHGRMQLRLKLQVPLGLCRTNASRQGLTESFCTCDKKASLQKSAGWNKPERSSADAFNPGVRGFKAI
jgi:hypothetical protein